MVGNWLIGGVIFLYTGWSLVRFLKRSKQGKCAACALNESCSSTCEANVEIK